MRYGIVTETYPPEVNGVALTVQGLEQGLRARGHDVDVVRPRQDTDGKGSPGTLLVRGAALPRYPGLKFGLPATRTLRRHWQATRPDALYVATEGPLGWSALRAARQLGIPVATGFHTRFDDYMRDNPDFVFCGVQRGDDLARHFASGDLFVFASHSETFGNVTLEALASGVPTVAFDYGAAGEFLRSEVHGAAIADGDDAGFVEAVVRIGSDAAMRNAMRAACRDAVAGLRPAQVAEDFDRILQGLPRNGRQHVAAAAT